MKGPAYELEDYHYKDRYPGYVSRKLPKVYTVMGFWALIRFDQMKFSASRKIGQKDGEHREHPISDIMTAVFDDSHN